MTTSQNPFPCQTPCGGGCDCVDTTPVDESYSPRHAKKTPLVGKLRDLLAAWKTEHPVELPPVEIPTVSKQYVERTGIASDPGPEYLSEKVRDLTDLLLWNKAAADVPVSHYLGALSFCSGVERDLESGTYELIVVMTATYGPMSSVPGVDE